jgi:hypothetical protein
VEHSRQLIAKDEQLREKDAGAREQEQNHRAVVTDKDGEVHAALEARERASSQVRPTSLAHSISRRGVNVTRAPSALSRGCVDTPWGPAHGTFVFDLFLLPAFAFKFRTALLFQNRASVFVRKRGFEFAVSLLVKPRSVSVYSGSPTW